MQFNDKIFGEIEILEPVVLDLIQTPQMQRIKKIHQYGIYHYFNESVNTTRFEHSLGVYLILEKFSNIKEEKLAGLLHDISHGIFSHVMDHLYDKYEKEDYQKEVNKQYFTSEVGDVLKKYNIDPNIVEDVERWPLAENHLPDICADRLQYTLGDAVTINKIDQKGAKIIIEDLIVEDEKFIFQSENIAKEFAELSLWMCSKFWHPNWGVYSYNMIKNIIIQAMKKGILKKTDLATNDDVVIKKLEECKDAEIVGAMKKLKNLNTKKVIETEENFDYIHPKSKFRVINPLVKKGNKLVRVTELFPEFKLKFNKEKERVNRPRKLKLVE